DVDGLDPDGLRAQPRGGVVGVRGGGALFVAADLVVAGVVDLRHFTGVGVVRARHGGGAGRTAGAVRAVVDGGRADEVGRGRAAGGGRVDPVVGDAAGDLGVAVVGARLPDLPGQRFGVGDGGAGGVGDARLARRAAALLVTVHPAEVRGDGLGA